MKGPSESLPAPSPFARPCSSLGDCERFRADAQDTACGVNHYVARRRCGRVSTQARTTTSGYTAAAVAQRLLSMPDVFHPDTLTINAGDSVTFIALDDDLIVTGPHNVVADDGSFRCARGCDEGGR